MKRKSIVIVIVIILLFLAIKKFNVKNIKYTIKSNNTKYTIVEKRNKDYYYFDITGNKKIFSINIFGLSDHKKQINKIYSFNNDNYSCVLPLFSDKVLTDIMCYKEDILYNYQSIKNKDKELDDYVKTIKEYKIEKVDSKENKFNNIISYYDDINKKVSITTYKGLIIDKEEVKLFDKDVYNNKISTYIDNYYITADYNSNYEFEKFYLVNLSNKEVSTIKVKNPISFDSYIQGIVDNKLYIFDPENEVQYEINPRNKEINIVSNDYIKYYSNNKWSKVSVKQAKKELLFSYEELGNKYNDYDKAFENNYYTYLIKDKSLYRINKNNIKIKTYILDVPVKDISTNKDYLYYIYNEGLYYYSDVTGLKLVLINKELEFNKNIKCYIY